MGCGCCRSGPARPASGADPGAFWPSYWAHRDELDHGTISIVEYWERVAADVGASWSPAELAELWVRDFRGWLWQEDRCLQRDDAGCARRTFYSVRLPVAVLDGVMAPVLLSRSNRMIVRIPEDVQTGRLEIRQNGQASNSIRLKIARLITGNLHPVGNPAVDAEGNNYSTDSGPRGQKTAVSVYRITPSGEMQPFVSGITNATGLALDPQGYLYVSSRLDGTVHRVWIVEVKRDEVG